MKTTYRCSFLVGVVILVIVGISGCRPADIPATLALAPTASHTITPDATVNRTRLTPRVEMQETLMLGLRLTQEGVSAAAFQERFGQEMQFVFAKEIGELERLGLLEWAGDALRMTRPARLVGNQVFLRFVGE